MTERRCCRGDDVRTTHPPRAATARLGATVLPAERGTKRSGRQGQRAQHRVIHAGLAVWGRFPAIGLILLLLPPIQAVGAQDTHTGAHVWPEHLQPSRIMQAEVDAIGGLIRSSVEVGFPLTQAFTCTRVEAIAARSDDGRRARRAVLVRPAPAMGTTGGLSRTLIAPGDPFLRVRSSDASITTRIEQATARSPTFKRLVTTIERSNGIIYVESGVCPGRVASCLPIWMSSRGSQRFLRIIVDRRRLETDPPLIGAIGHELQHSIEVLRDRHVTGSTTMLLFYQRYAPTGQARFETPEASHAGIAVEDEWRTWCDVHR
jgi:hypothetical protein